MFTQLQPWVLVLYLSLSAIVVYCGVLSVLQDSGLVALVIYKQIIRDQDNLPGGPTKKTFHLLSHFDFLNRYQGITT